MAAACASLLGWCMSAWGLGPICLPAQRDSLWQENLKKGCPIQQEQPSHLHLVASWPGPWACAVFLVLPGCGHENRHCCRRSATVHQGGRLVPALAADAGLRRMARPHGPAL